MKSYQDITDDVVRMLERANIIAAPGGITRQLIEYVSTTQKQAYDEGVQKGDSANPLTKLARIDRPW